MGCVSLCWGLDKQDSASVPKCPTFRVQDTGLKLSNTLSCDNAKITHKLLNVFTKHHDIVVGTYISCEIRPYFRRNNSQSAVLRVITQVLKGKVTILVENGKEILISNSSVLTIDDYLLSYKSFQLRQRCQVLNYQ